MRLSRPKILRSSHLVLSFNKFVERARIFSRVQGISTCHIAQCLCKACSLLVVRACATFDLLLSAAFREY